MLASALVIGACLNQTGCTESTTAFKHFYPVETGTLEQRLDAVKSLVVPAVTQYVAPIVLFSYTNEAIVPIFGALVVKYKSDVIELSYGIDF